MRKFNIVQLPYWAATVNAMLFGMAGYRYFNLGIWGAVIGVGVGAVISFSIAVAASRIGDISQKRIWLARVALFGMMSLSPLTITLSLFAPTSVFTAIAWAMDTDLAILLAGSIGGNSLFASSKPAKPKVRTKKPAFYCSVPGCKRNKATPGAIPFTSKAALAGHQGAHVQKKATP